MVTSSSDCISTNSFESGMPRSERKYNYFHSRTRIIVERAFGGLKSRWRILKRVLNMKSPASIGRTIVSCMVLHNLTVELGDDCNIGERIDPFCGQHFRDNQYDARVSTREEALAKRNILKDYVNGFC